MEFLLDERTQVMYSADIEDIESKNLNDDEKRIQVKCVVGNNPRQAIPLALDSKGGTISLKLK
jgi:hypothetical protein